MHMIPGFEKYNGDPLVWKDGSEAGNLPHTMTGIRKTFPNLQIHRIINKLWLPARRGFVQHMIGKDETYWSVNVMTYAHETLDHLANGLKSITFSGQTERANQTLAQRRESQAAFVAEAKSKELSIEQLSQRMVAQHSDPILQPSTSESPSLLFEWNGNHPDYPQPTPGRFPNADAMMFVIGLDLLLVFMTQCNSATERRHINAYDNAVMQGGLADLYSMATLAGRVQTPNNPDGVRRSQLDMLWNADGSADRPLNEGAGQRGDEAIGSGGNAPAAGNPAAGGADFAGFGA